MTKIINFNESKKIFNSQMRMIENYYGFKLNFILKTILKIISKIIDK